mgnify:CR=1 FL=1
MAEMEGVTSNSLYETLEDWNSYLKQENVDFEKLSPRIEPAKPRMQRRGPSI